MKFLIINQHTLNFGDDIAGYSLIQQILKKFPNKDTEVEIIYNTHGSLEYPDSRVKDRMDLTLKEIGFIQIFIYIMFSLVGIKLIYKDALRKFRNTVDDSDSILVSPGGANLGIYKDWRYLLKLYLVVTFGGKPIFHYNTIGFSGNILFDFLETKVLKKSEIYVRELASYELLAKRKIFSIRGVDTAFSFFNNISVRTIDEDYMVFIPTELNSWHPSFVNDELSGDRFNLILEQIAKVSKENGFKVVILQHMHGEATEKNLYDRCEAKLKELGCESVEIPNIEDCYMYVSIIQYAKFVVSMRYHGVVMSIKNNTPFCSLEYENKMAEVCRYSGKLELNQKIKDVDQSFNLNEVFQKSLNNENDFRSQLSNMANIPMNQVKFIKTGKIV